MAMHGRDEQKKDDILDESIDELLGSSSSEDKVDTSKREVGGSLGDNEEFDADIFLESGSIPSDRDAEGGSAAESPFDDLLDDDEFSGKGNSTTDSKPSDESLLDDLLNDEPNPPLQSQDKESTDGDSTDGLDDLLEDLVSSNEDKSQVDTLDDKPAGQHQNEKPSDGDSTDGLDDLFDDLASSNEDKSQVDTLDDEPPAQPQNEDSTDGLDDLFDDLASSNEDKPQTDLLDDELNSEQNLEQPTDGLLDDSSSLGTEKSDDEVLDVLGLGDEEKDDEYNEEKTLEQVMAETSDDPINSNDKEDNVSDGDKETSLEQENDDFDSFLNDLSSPESPTQESSLDDIDQEGGELDSLFDESDSTAQDNEQSKNESDDFESMFGEPDSSSSTTQDNDPNDNESDEFESMFDEEDKGNHGDSADNLSDLFDEDALEDDTNDSNQDDSDIFDEPHQRSSVEDLLNEKEEEDDRSSRRMSYNDSFGNDDSDDDDFDSQLDSFKGGVGTDIDDFTSKLDHLESNSINENESEVADMGGDSILEQVADTYSEEIEENKENIGNKEEPMKDQSGNNSGNGRSGILKGTAIVLLSLGVGLAGGVYGPKYLGDYLPGAMNQSEIATTNEVSTLRNKVVTLEGEIEAKDKEYLNKLLLIQNSLSSIGETQSTVSEKVSKLSKEQVELESALNNYEKEMLARFKQVIEISQSSLEKQSEQSQLIKDAVLREALEVIRNQESDPNSKKLIAVATEVEQMMNKVAQIEARQMSQRQVSSLMEDEMGYVKKKVSEMEKSMIPYKPPVQKDGPGSADTPPDKKAEASISIVSKSELKKEAAKAKQPTQVDSGNDFVEMVVAGVHFKGNGSYDIYVQPLDNRNHKAVEPYWFSRGRSSSTIPGYGKILDVIKLENTNLLVNYVVVTENGEIRGRR